MHIILVSLAILFMTYPFFTFDYMTNLLLVCTVMNNNLMTQPVSFSRAPMVFCMLILLLLPQILTAEPVYLEFRPTSSEITQFRYRISEEGNYPWVTSDIKSPLITLEDFDKSNGILTIQQSSDGSSWGQEILFRFNTKDNKWEVFSKATVAPVLAQEPVKEKRTFGASSIDIRGQYILPLGLCSDSYDTGFGGKLQINFSSSGSSQNTDLLLPYTTLFYQRPKSSTSLVSSFQIIGTTLGLGIPLFVNPALKVSIDIEAGIMQHIITWTAQSGGPQSYTLYLDPIARVATTFVVGTDDGIQLVTSTGISSFFEKGAIGVLMSLEAGLRINW
ncbi:hypothetical protein [uncultured Sphaerochaeta sp.]|uniref:hypothetical protein n=1 Tax=uncultured Sphaerochaeta sp. TaxID=886478 RepID=UPI003747DA47